VPDFSSVGGLVLLPPGTLSAWGSTVIHRAVAVTRRPVKIVRLHFAEPDLQFDAKPGVRVICLSDYPTIAVLEMLAERNIPVVCFADPPQAAIRHLMAELTIPLDDALRRYTASSTAFPLLDSANALIVRRTDNARAAEIVTSVLHHLDLVNVVSESKRSLFEQNLMYGTADLETVLCSEISPFVPIDTSNLGQVDLGTISAVTDGLYAPLVGCPKEAIIWPREVLRWGGHPEEVAPPYIDIVGPNRVLYHGPYFYLPAGRYVMKAHVGFSEDAVNHPFAIELHGASCIARADFQPRSGGWFHLGMEFLHSAPTERVEVHLTSMRGAIHGRVSLNNVALIPT